MMYGGFVAGSVFDSQMQADMQEIGWNPFNSNEAATLGSGSISFYKGMPVFRIGAGSRSGSFMGIYLARGSGIDTLRHEWGHGIQQGILGAARFGITAGITSPPALGPWDKAGNYFAAPWETIADIFGGVQGRSHTNEAKTRAWLYLATGLLFPPAAFFFLLWK